MIDNAFSGIQTIYNCYTVVILMVVLLYLYISSSSFSSLFLHSFLLVLYLGNHYIYRLFNTYRTEVINQTIQRRRECAT